MTTNKLDTLTDAERAAYKYIYLSAQHQNAHYGWPGRTSSRDFCQACFEHALTLTGIVWDKLEERLVHKITDELRLRTWLDVADAIAPVHPEAARLIRSVVKDDEDEQREKGA